MAKKTNILFFSFFTILFLLANFSSSYAAWKLNAGYPQLPGVNAPTIDANSRLPHYILYFFGVAIYIAGALAVLSLVIAGIQLMMAAENPSRIGAAKERAVSSVVGLVILLGAVVILNTINPKITKFGITIEIKEPSGLWLTGKAGKTGAPFAVNDFHQDFGDNYDSIVWPETIQDINGKTYDNCDDGIYAYRIYFYKNPGRGALIADQEIRCGGKASIGNAASYIAVAEKPGVYLYPDAYDCRGRAGSNDTPISVTTSSEQDMPRSGKKVTSIRIINGRENVINVGQVGPFFGVVAFDESDYHGRQMLHWSPPTDNGDQGCFQVASEFSKITGVGLDEIEIGSLIVYQRLNDHEKTESAGAGITLSTERSGSVGRLSGVYCPEEHPDVCRITGEDIEKAGTSWNGNLSEMEVTPQVGGVSVPKDEATACQYFSNGSGENKTNNCFQSMEIDGNFLVILSYYEDLGGGGGRLTKGMRCFLKSDSCYQAFPATGFLKGPPDINRTTIKQSARYIEIIPLAKPWR